MLPPTDRERLFYRGKETQMANQARSRDGGCSGDPPRDRRLPDIVGIAAISDQFFTPNSVWWCRASTRGWIT
jgi:hypothetical protein